MDAQNNEIFKFSGLSAELLKKLFESGEFTFESAEKILSIMNVEKVEELNRLWGFCLSEKIIRPVS